MISKLYNKLKDKDLTVGLVAGLAAALVAALAWGLAMGLVAGLAWGLVAALAGGLVGGLANLSELLPLNMLNVIGLIIAVLVLSEILFIIFTEKKKNPSWKYVLEHKIESLFESLLIIINLLNIKWIVRNVDFAKYLPSIVKWIGYIGIGILCLAVIIGLGYLWVQANKRLVTKK